MSELQHPLLSSLLRNITINITIIDEIYEVDTVDVCILSSRHILLYTRHSTIVLAVYRYIYYAIICCYVHGNLQSTTTINSSINMAYEVKG